MKCLITGAAGFIGHHLANRLARDGHDVVGVDSSQAGDWSRVDPRVERLQLDITTLATSQWDEIVEGQDKVFHLAAKKYNTPGVTSEELLATNVAATHALFQAAGRAAVGRLIFASSLYAYGSMGPKTMTESDLPVPNTLYGASKLMGEQLCRIAQRDFGLQFNVARLFFIFGPEQHADGGYKSVIVTNFQRMRSGLPPTINGDGEQELDYLYIDDCLNALWALATCPHSGHVINVASGTGRSINALTADMQRVVGDTRDPKKMDTDWTHGSRRVGDPTLLRQLTNWSPHVSLEQGLQLTYRDPSLTSR